MFDRVGIIGVGLMGGSLARAMRRAGIAGRIVGAGRTPGRLEYALRNGIVDKVADSPQAAAADADLVVISTPVRLIPGILEGIFPALGKEAIVTDVGSAKREITLVGERVYPPGGPFFVGAHPMAGSEDSGVEASREDLFENALCVVTRTERTDGGAVERVRGMWEAVGAKALVMPPDRHDTLVAAASHLPHLVAVSLVKCLAGLSGRYEEILPLLAGGFRDTTRIASGSPEVWRDICLANRECIVSALKEFQSALDETAAKMDSAAGEGLRELFESAKAFRDSVPEGGGGALPPEFGILVDAADRPGIMGQIATTLGEEGINIKNLHVRHVREMRGGTISLTLENEGDEDRALKALRNAGFKAGKKR